MNLDNLVFFLAQTSAGANLSQHGSNHYDWPLVLWGNTFCSCFFAHYLQIFLKGRVYIPSRPQMLHLHASSTAGFGSAAL